MFATIIAMAGAVGACTGIMGGSDDMDRVASGEVSTKDTIAASIFQRLSKSDRCGIAREDGGQRLDIANAAIVSVMEQAKIDKTKLDPIKVRQMYDLAITMGVKIDDCEATRHIYGRIMALANVAGDPPKDVKSIDLAEKRDILMLEFFSKWGI